MKYRVYFHKYKGTEQYVTWSLVVDLKNFSAWDSTIRSHTKDDPGFYLCLERVETPGERRRRKLRAGGH